MNNRIDLYSLSIYYIYILTKLLPLLVWGDSCMGKQIMITEEMYNTLLELKVKNRKKSFTTLLKDMCRDLKTQDMLVAEVSGAYEDVKKCVLGSGLDSGLVDLCDKMKVITVNLAKMRPRERARCVGEIKTGLDKLVAFTEGKVVVKKKYL